MNKDIDIKVKEIISEQLNVPLNEIDNESTLVEDLGADSLDIVEIIMALEEEFNIEITDEDARCSSIDTVRSAIELVKVKLPQDKQ